MQVISLKQGSPEWHSHRATHFNASDAPAMMGCSSYKTRNQLLQEIVTGITPEIDAATQRRFDDGHRFEELACKRAEVVIGEDLYPVVGVDGKYSASFDGLTMDYSIGFEHKTFNARLRDSFCGGDGKKLPLEYRVQMEHQMMVSGATQTLFMATKWDNEGNVDEEMDAWYESDAELRAQIVAGWLQFEEDLKTFVPFANVEPLVATPKLGLPAVTIQVNGSIALIDNLDVFGNALTKYIDGLNKEPQTDQDFADLDGAVKTLKNAESALAAAEAGALAQTASIDTMRKTVALYSDMARTNRLMFEKIVTKEKEARKLAIIQAGRDAITIYVTTLNNQMDRSYLQVLSQDVAAVTKGLKTIESIKNAVDTEVSRIKIELNRIAGKIKANLETLKSLSEFAFLFSDEATLVFKEPEDMAAIVTNRINSHNEKEAARFAEKVAAEQARAEQERIRAEEATKLAVQRVQAETIAPLPVAEISEVRTVTRAPQSGKMINLGELCRRLGFLVTADFLSTFGFEATIERNSKLYREADFTNICQALIAHLQNTMLEAVEV
jgi:putative phage-type endonuclease